MCKIRIPKKVLLLYLAIAPLSCLLFLPYIKGSFWMFFSCLFAYFIQLGVGSGIFSEEGNLTYERIIKNEIELEKLDTTYRVIRVIAISIILLTILLDTFPFWASSNWFCHSVCRNTLGFYLPNYEGGILVSIMTIVIILFWIFMILGVINDIKSPSRQYCQSIKEKEEGRKLKERENLRIQAHHQQNVALYGKEYQEIFPLFIFNDTTKKLWLCNIEYAFDDILDADIEEITNQYTTGGDIITRTKTGSMLGRAAVGGLLTGGVGAIIGGATAKKESIISPTEIHTEHTYNILVTTKNISNPLITVPCNENSGLAQKCLATLKAIIHSK